MNAPRRRVTRRIGALVAVLALVTAWCAWRFAATGDGTDPELAPTQVNAAPVATAGAPAAPESGEAQGARSEVATPVPEGEAPLVVPDELAHPYLYVLVVRTLDADGLPIRGAPLRLAPVRAKLNEVRALAEIDGWTTIAWRGKEPETEVDVQFGDGFGGARRVHLSAGVPHEVALLGDEDAPAVLHASFRLVSLGGEGAEQSFTLELDSPVTIAMERMPHPHARFGDLLLERPPQPTPPEPAESPAIPVLGDVALTQASIQVALGERFQGRLPLITSFRHARPDVATEEAGARVEILLLDERGAPAESALVVLGRELDGADQRSTTDGDGRVVFEGVGAGWWEVRAGGGMEGLARERLFVEPPVPTARTLSLARGAHVRGRVEDSEGEPRSDVLVRYESTPDALATGSTVRVNWETRGGEEVSERGTPAERKPGTLRAPWVDQVTPRADGTFEIANLPPGLGRLVVVPAGDSDGASLLVEEGVLPSDQAYVLRTPRVPGGINLAISIPASAGVVPAEIEVRAISLATGRGSLFRRHDGENGKLLFLSTALAAGAYRVEVGAGAFGFHDLGVHLVADGTLSDLGEFAPPPPARLELVGPADRKATLYLRRADLDLRVEPREAPGGSTVLLPAGDYWVFWQDGEGLERRGGLTLEAGATARFALE